MAVVYRLPLWLAFLVVIFHEDLSPLSIHRGIGPSMLPTIATTGEEIWLVYSVQFGQKLRSLWPAWLGNSKSSSARCLQVGDLVVWRRPLSPSSADQCSHLTPDGTGENKLACKRVIGVEGDTVLRYGEYATLYSKTRDDGGVRWPATATSLNWVDIDNDGEGGAIQAKTNINDADIDWNQTYVVPKGHVWLEGDCPLLSFDSRHVGPIPEDWIRGKLLFRLWPLLRPQPRRQRPVPHAHLDDYLGPAYNLYRIQRQDVPPNSPSSHQNSQQ